MKEGTYIECLAAKRAVWAALVVIAMLRVDVCQLAPERRGLLDKGGQSRSIPWAHSRFKLIHQLYYV